MRTSILRLAVTALFAAGCGDELPPVPPPGPQGPIGPQGAQGEIGPQGPQGVPGEVGATGPQGVPGEVGASGPQGAQGDVGPIGPQGAQGVQGDVGPMGPMGLTGAQGPQGDVGATGAQGPQGDVGATGAQGPQGDVGATGAQGPQGDVGATGPQGDVGPQGPQGDVGATGAQGPQGDLGPQGPQGDIGATGAQGDIGPQGPQGVQGIQGPAGSANITGSTNFLTKFTSATTGGNSLLFDNGTAIGLGTTAPSWLLHVRAAGAISARAENTSAANDALWGINTAATGTLGGAGVVGISLQANALAAGVFGEDDHANGNGVIGVANGQGSAVLTSGGAGGSFNGLMTGVLARSTNVAVGQAIYTTQTTDVVRVGYYDGATFYKINGVGTVSTNVVDATDPDGGRITLHAPESPEIVFEDYGDGQLVDGRAHVELDPRFAGAVTIDAKHPLRVFIQLEDDEDIVGVVVKHKTARGFDVVERQGGRSHAPFQWHAIANRADEVLPSGRISHNADVRFEPLAPAEKLATAAGRVSSGATTGGTTTGGAPTPQLATGVGDDVDPTAAADDAPADAAASGCSTSRGGGSLVLIGLALALALARRRRSCQEAG